MRRSIDDHPFTAAELPPDDEDVQHLSWAVAIGDDYEDAEPRVILTVEEVGNPGAGLVAHSPRRSPGASASRSATPSVRSAKIPARDVLTLGGGPGAEAPPEPSAARGGSAAPSSSALQRGP